MLVIVGKADPHPVTKDIEYFLVEFRQMLAERGQFVYAWSFNPDGTAITTVRRSLDGQEGVYLYLPRQGGMSNIRMCVADIRHDRRLTGMGCPPRMGGLLHRAPPAAQAAGRRASCPHVVPG